MEEEDKSIDLSVWAYCAGVFDFDHLQGRVYYSPQGHVENFTSSDIVRYLCSDLAMVPCELVTAKYLADPKTDEVFAYFKLKPPTSDDDPNEETCCRETIRSADGFIKVLDQSDVTNPGECTISAACLGADKVLPKEDTLLSIHDIHSQEWKLKHTYDSTLELHKFTDGWDRFVLTKQLSPGDSLVFVKTRVGLTIGIRRVTVPGSASVDSFFHYPTRVNDVHGGQKLIRTGKGLLSVEALGEALAKSQIGRPFDVVYYPHVGSSSFVLDRERVYNAIWNVTWPPGMKVRKWVMVKDQLRVICHEGSVISSIKKDKDWYGSPWRQLQVNWDKKYGSVEEFVNFWEVEPVPEPVSGKKRKLGDMTATQATTTGQTGQTMPDLILIKE
ncbi:PREDICTED: auxin response factor 17-like [Camelina sativa]|uniref:Auxin response factor n=1 Tax=Camelina sativa TaxID=90675 RepID=A0ABM1R5Z0_CAMSA|nr:PREDICTED: auxin response factor 17-like [Camelina sativa]